MKKTLLLFLFILLAPSLVKAQPSIAREWNDVLLDAIREDYARPTVVSRNLFHASVVMYDAWAVFSEDDDTYFLGNTLNGFECVFDGITEPADVNAAREEVLSYACFRLLWHRFLNSPGVLNSLTRFTTLMEDKGYDISFTSTDYSTGSYAALGNYLGSKMIEYGLADGANEQNEYVNEYYEPVNDALITIMDGNPNITDPNRWQPLTLDVFIDQGGNPIPINTPEFLSPEWGNVWGFALTDDDKTEFQRQGDFYNVYHDPGTPPYLGDPMTDAYYKWGFQMVSVWQSHLDPYDGVMWDISPAAKGGIDFDDFPDDWSEYDDFYDFYNGGTLLGDGHSVNPSTGLPYEPQIVPRGDFARILAEFWADGPDSELPPGHWFTILNYVNDQPELVKKFTGYGELLDDFEWDVKSYFILGGAMHDAAIAAWGIKGWYDYIRPISALRYMGDKGQSTSDALPNYDPSGLELIDDYIELVMPGDSLEGDTSENLYKIKLFTWKGHDYIENDEIDEAGVGWILAEDWWPYQRPSFVTPPFAGFVSGHSTYSRAAAEALTMLTGDPYFPGGMGEFFAGEDEFLVFEDGPSMDVTLQWATYRDASDECSLSRIWGGIHPPADDIPGRKIGKGVGIAAFNMAASYFRDTNVPVIDVEVERLNLFPNPVKRGEAIQIQLPVGLSNAYLEIRDTKGQLVFNRSNLSADFTFNANELAVGNYFIQLKSGKKLYNSIITVQ